MYNETIKLKTKNDEITVSANFGEKLSIKGCKYANVDDIEYEKNLTELGEKFFKVEKENGFDRTDDEKCWKTVNETLNLIKNYVEKLCKHLRLDKSIILNALERNRTYSYRNYYQNSNLPNIPEIEIISDKLRKANQEIYDIKKAHEKEKIEWQKKVSVAKKLFAKATKIKTEGEADWSVGDVNCPYCDSYEDVSLYFEDHEGGSANHECGKCCEVFTVEFEGL